MKQNKNIDKIFSDRFKNAEINPPDDIWEGISSQLPLKKRKNRIVPLWYYLGGTAAALIIIALLLRTSFVENTSPTITDHNSENSIKVDKINDSNSPTLENEKHLPMIKNQNEIVGTGASISKENSSNSKNSKQEQFYTTVIGTDQHERSSSHSDQITNRKRKEDISLKSISLNSGGVKLGDHSTFKRNIGINEPTKEITKIMQPQLKPEKEELAESSSNSDRFSVSANAAALYFDNLGSGSSLSNQIASNAGGLTSTSYGVSFGYLVTERLKIRSGISQVELKDNFQNTTYASVLNSKAIGNDFSVNSALLTTTDVVEAAVKIDQNIGFIEVPTEIEYFILNKKFGFSFITGFSTLILNKNKISITSDNFNSVASKVENLNNLSFTANLGMGLNYKIVPKLQLHLEPIVKYQLNTFNNTQDYKPYYIGFYSGLTYKF